MDDEAIREIFEGLGEVQIRRMFGGKGIYHRGLIIALDTDDGILLKGDDTVARHYEEAGAKRWVYENRRSKAPVKMPYWSVPAEILDEPESFTQWTRLAFESAVRAEKAKL